MATSNKLQTIYLDLETTGLSYKHDEIVEIGILADDGIILLDTQVRPVRKQTWPQAQAIHGISPDDVREAPTLADLSDVIQAIVEGKEIIIYNMAFDLRFLVRQLAKAASIRCCMKAFARYYGGQDRRRRRPRQQKLTTAAEHVEFIWPGEAHRAINDCMATRAVWRYLMDPARRHPATMIGQARKQSR
ncbi:MAG: hypothetical protein ETSY1_09120 [Candidatus Entotheonella factor]|uniref:Exonuclease domain-containing protein n=1 Tax=Entotheonella factor TaxID=1429438 RepID=W4LT10_ENTF1|nr:MAG: hypothetical protein ETSY1_09120 [Candidatus Entotheonella factor]